PEMDAAVPAEAGGDAAVPPDSAVGNALAFVLATVNGKPLTAASVTANFAPPLTQAARGSSALSSLFAHLRAYKPLGLVGFAGPVTATELTAVVTQNEHEYWRIEVAVASAKSQLIEGLLFDPAPELDPALQSYADLDKALKAVAPDVSALAATLDAKGCT